MSTKFPVLTLLFAGLICSVTWLRAEEPRSVSKEAAATDVDVNSLLKRIDELETRVKDLQLKLALQSAERRIFLRTPDNRFALPQPDSSILKNLPPHEINGQRFYFAPLKDR